MARQDLVRLRTSLNKIFHHLRRMRTLLASFSTFLLLLISPLVAGLSASMADASSAKHVLIDMPVSNHGARCRVILYKKQVPEQECSIVSPMEYGGLKSDDYREIHPQAKMPALVCRDSGLKLPESEVIARYLCSTYAAQGPSFLPEHPISNLICRIHDQYMSPVQAAMYKMGPFGSFGHDRKAALQEYVKQMAYLEDLYDGTSLYLCGSEESLADATLFPSLVFAARCLPKFDLAVTPKLAQYFERLQTEDSEFAKIFAEVDGALQGWEERNRWGPLLGAGTRDTAPPTIFDKIVAKAIPGDIVLETEHVLAFKDINPAAPAHVLVIPKDRNGLSRLSKATQEHREVLGKLLLVASEISNQKELGFNDGARIVINDGPDGGQEVPHLHVHVLGGRSLTWPPG